MEGEGKECYWRSMQPLGGHFRDNCKRPRLEIGADWVELVSVRPGQRVWEQVRMQWDSLLPWFSGQLGQNFVGVWPEWVKDCSKNMDHRFNILPPQYIVWGSPAGVSLLEQKNLLYEPEP